MPPLLKSKPRAYSERNLHRLQNKHGIIASTKEGESSESSYKRGPSRGVQNGLYSDSDPKFESDDSAFLTPYIRNGDQQSISGIYELFLTNILFAFCVFLWFYFRKYVTVVIKIWL